MIRRIFVCGLKVAVFAFLSLFLVACASRPIPLTKTSILTGLFDNNLEKMEMAFEQINKGMPAEEVRELGFKMKDGVERLCAADVKDSLYGAGSIIEVPADKKKADAFAQHLNRFCVETYPYVEVRNDGWVGAANWNVGQSGFKRSYSITFYQENDGTWSVFAKKPSFKDPVGVVTKEAFEMLTGAAASTFKGASERFGTGVTDTYGPFTK